MERMVSDLELRQWVITAKAVIDPESGCVLHDHAIGPGASLAEIEERLRQIADLSMQIAGWGERAYELGLHATWVRLGEIFGSVTDARDALRQARLELLAAQAPDATGDER